MALVTRASTGRETATSPTTLATASVGTLLALSMLAWVMAFAPNGLDFTDEGYYLASLRSPGLYPATVTQFGFVYHPLFLLAEGDVALLRQLNVLLTFGLAALLGYRTLSDGFSLRDQRRLAVAIAAQFAVASLTLCGLWLLTPNYNGLTFQGALITTLGWTLLKQSPASVAGALAVGVGGALTLLAKPTSALALAVLTLAFLACSGAWRWRSIALACASSVTALLLASLLIDGNVLQFMRRLADGADLVSGLGGGHSWAGMFRFDRWSLTSTERVLIASLAASTAIAAILATLRARIALGAWAVIIASAIGTASCLMGWNPAYTLPQTGFLIMLIWGPIIGIIVGSALGSRGKPWRGSALRDGGIALCFFLVPHAVALGSNTNYWATGGIAGFFWAIGALYLIRPMLEGRACAGVLITFAAGIQIATVLVVAAAMERPYRQIAPLREQDTLIVLGANGGRLSVSVATARYIETWRQAASAAGFAPGMPMIDLSGQSPTLLFALGAQQIGQPWTIGGYPGSERRAVAALASLPCSTLSQAWVLIEPDGPRSLDQSVLASLGLDPTTYRSVASVMTPPGAGGYPASREQRLLRPGAEPSCNQGVPNASRTSPQSASVPHGTADG